MLDNQSRMRSMLDLLETVDQGKKIKLNESSYAQVSEADDIEDTYPDPETLADEALDAAARHIQDALGITTGDFAGMYFSGDNGARITDILADYAMSEMKNQRDDGQENLEEGMMKRMLEKRAEEMSKEQFVRDADEHGMSPEEAIEFWTAVNGEDEELDEDQDPNLSKAYHMGHDAYRAYKNDPEMAQAAQDKFDDMEIVKKNPEYAKMWVTGYRDGERFDKQSGKLEEAASRKDFRQVAELIKEIPDENKRRELAQHHCEIFKQQNPRFSTEKFMNYIGL